MRKLTRAVWENGRDLYAELREAVVDAKHGRWARKTVLWRSLQVIAPDIGKVQHAGLFLWPRVSTSKVQHAELFTRGKWLVQDRFVGDNV